MDYFVRKQVAINGWEAPGTFILVLESVSD